MNLVKLITGFAIVTSFCFSTEPFSIVLIPDTQYYSLRDSSTYIKQMQWIADSVEAKNIKFAIHLGDITHKNTNDEWEVASRAHKILDDAGVPYSIIPGNHDNPETGRVRNTTNYNRYFGVDRYQDKPWYGGHFETSNDNNYWLFEVDDLKFLVVGLEFAARKDALNWADSLVLAHPDRRVIVATHCYQTHGAVHCTTCGTGYDIAGSGGNTVWSEFVINHSNIFLAVSGHVGDSEYYIREGNNGNYVHEILTDYQFEKRDGLSNGNGWLRTLEFIPTDNLVKVRVHTVLDDVESFNQDDYSPLPYSSEHTYSFDYNMTTFEQGKYLRISNGFNDIAVQPNDIFNQENPAIAMNPAGDFFIAFEEGSYLKSDIGLRGFNASGRSCFKIQYMTSDGLIRNQNPAVDANKDNVVLAWDEKYFNQQETWLSCLTKKGDALFTKIRVNPIETGIQKNPAVAIGNAGNIIVVWEDDENSDGKFDIIAREFYLNGEEKTSARMISSPDGNNINPEIEVNSNGDFVIIWQSINSDDQSKIFASSMNSTWQTYFSEKQLNSEGSPVCFNPSLDLNDSGQFIVVWENEIDSNIDIKMASYDIRGNTLLSDSTVNFYTEGAQEYPDVAISNEGKYIISFQDDRDGNGYYQIYAVEFNADFSRKTATNFTVNENGGGQQFKPQMAMHSSEQYVAVWEDDMNGNDIYEILAKGYDYGETYITPIVEEKPLLSGFQLYQNFPNPFNPLTSIGFTICRPAKVQISVFNLKGECVSALVDSDLNSGSYITKWDGSGFASGLYLYTLNVNGKIVSKKMTLVK